MKIRVLIPLLLSLAIITIISFAWANQRINVQINEELIEIQATNEVIRDISTLQNYTFKYLISPNESDRKEWWTIHDRINHVLASAKFGLKQEKEIIDVILQSNQSLENNFYELIKLVRSTDTSDNQSIITDRKNSLAIGMSSESKLMVDSSLKLNQIVENEMEEYQQFNQTLNNSLYLTMFFVIIISSQIGISRIVLPITRLHYAADLISKGNLDYKIGSKSSDEIGLLSNAFDKMAQQLNHSYSSLEQKVEARTEELSRSKAQAEAILSSIGDAVVACDTNGRIILLNHIALNYAGVGLNEAIGQPYNSIITFAKEGSDIPLEDIVTKVIKDRKAYFISNNISIIKKDGTRIPVADSAAPIFNESKEIVGCVIVYRDVTLERDVDRAKTEFVALASHQLRTPLASINWIAEMLLGKDFGIMTPKQKEMTEVILKSGRRMSELISALLNTSRLELGTFSINIKNINIKKVIGESLQDLKSIIRTKKVKVVQEYRAKDLAIEADPILLKIILQNLISNAVRYTLPKTTVTIKIDKDAKNYTFTIIDQGIGIPKSEERQIFQKLFRASNAQIVETDGTGLGLYMIKTITNMIGGDIKFESTGPFVSNGDLGGTGGTTFRVTIPLSGMKDPIIKSKDLLATCEQI